MPPICRCLLLSRHNALHQHARRNVWMSSIDNCIAVSTSENNLNNFYIHLKAKDSIQGVKAVVILH